MLLAFVLFSLTSIAAWGGNEVPDGEGKLIYIVANKVAGNYRSSDETVCVKGELFEDGYLYPSSWVIFDIRGWDYFASYIGISDDDYWKTSTTITIELDGEEVWRKKISYQNPATDVSIALNGHKTIKFTMSSTPMEANGLFISPKLYKGPPPSQAVQSTEVNTVKSPSVTQAPFAVDPKDLDTLATNLRSSVDEDQGLKSKVDNGQIAIMTFTLVDIPSPSVATNVAEDLTTAMIQKKFFLVERGQLDNVLKELKIQESGLVDPATALQIGELTGCDLILLGSISDRGQFVVINARLMETETGKSVVAQRVEMRKIPIEY